MIIATQRPSVDVITGQIKANFPTRIVTGYLSRGFPDHPDFRRWNLIGKGDMLYYSWS